VVAIAGLVVFSGRVYTNAILHTGPTLRLRDAWRSQAARASASDAGTLPSDHGGRRPTRVRWTGRHRPRSP
jgi:hypothetical protein